MWQQAAAGGGTLATIGIIGFVVKNLIDAFLEKKRGDTVSVSSSVTDAATANAVVLGSLKALEDENLRLRNDVAVLKQENEEKDQRIFDQDQKISVLETRLSSACIEIKQIHEELTTLKKTRNEEI